MKFMRAACRLSLLGLLVVLVNLPTLHHPMVHDDLHTILLNPTVRRSAAWREFFTNPDTFSAETRMYRPLLMLSYTVNFRLAGADPFSFHLVNLALHLFAGAMVFWLARLLPPLRSGAFWITLLFALHPVHTETLNYISCRSDLGASAFTLLALAAGLQVLTAEKSRPLFALLALSAFAAGLGFKSIAIVTPALLLLLAFLFFSPGRPGNLLDFSTRGRRAFGLTFLGLSLLALAYLWLRHALELETFFPQRPPRPLFINLLTQTRGLLLYLRLLLWPFHLRLEHELPIVESPLSPAFLGSAGVLLLLAAAALLCRRRAPVISLSVAWFLLCLLPTVYVPLNVLASENRVYLASLAGVWILVRLALLLPTGLRALTGRVLLVLAALCFALLSWFRHPVWSSGLALWRDAVRKAPSLSRTHVNYGIELRQAGKPAEAVRQYQWALRLNPRDSKAYSNLATAYYDLGRRAEELSALQKTLELDPGNVVARRNLAYALMEAGRGEEAVAVLDAATQLAPRRADLRAELGALYLRLGRPEAAARELEESLKLNPDQPEVRFALDQIRGRAQARESAGE